jgi:hypothetical protein
LHKFGEALFGSLSKALHDDDFVARHRTKPTAFIRERKLPFQKLCLIMIWNLRAALHLDLERFFDLIGPNTSSPKPSAFSRARACLKASAFRELNDQIITVAGEFGLRDNLWNGLRLLATDGSTLRLPKGSPAIAEHFGGMTSRHDTFLPMARMSYLYEVRTNLIIDAQLTPYVEGECSHAYELIGGNVWSEDLTLYDRGYNDPRIIAWSMAQESHFVIRVAVGNSAGAQQFVDSGKSEAEFDLTLEDALVEEFEGCGLKIPKTFRLRFIRVVLDTGEVEVLITNLTDRDRYPADQFGALYHERWGVEEGIKTSKCKIEIENWTGKSVASVEQDFRARIVCQNIAASVALTAQPALDEATADCRHNYKINMKRAIGLIRDQFVKLMMGTPEELKTLLSKLAERLKKAACIVRPGRSYPRRAPRRIPPAAPYKPIV